MSASDAENSAGSLVLRAIGGEVLPIPGLRHLLAGLLLGGQEIIERGEAFGVAMSVASECLRRLAVRMRPFVVLGLWRFCAMLDQALSMGALGIPLKE